MEDERSVGDFSPCGSVVFMIIAQRRLSTLTQYLTWFGKSPISTGVVYIIRDRGESHPLNSYLSLLHKAAAA
jgi:hypothetical protein